MPLRRGEMHHIRRWAAQLHGAGRAPRGIALVLSAWRGFYRWLGQRGPGRRQSGGGRARAQAPPSRCPRRCRSTTRWRSWRIATSAPTPMLAARDACIVELLYGCGLRVGELVGLDVGASGSARRLDRCRRRRAPTCSARAASGAACRSARRRCRRWRPGWRCAARCARPGEPALFVSRRGTRLHREPGALAPATRSALAAGLPTHVHPHMLRHSFAVARAAVERRPARGAGAARPRQHHDDAGLHPARLRPSLQGLRRGASARAKRKGDVRARRARPSERRSALRAGKERSLLRRHPWVFEGSVARRQRRRGRDGARRSRGRPLPRLGRVQPAVEDPPARLELRRGRAHRRRLLRRAASRARWRCARACRSPATACGWSTARPTACRA